ncbi:Guanine nucleotide-binding protein subunit gamma-e [Papilio xuthus]|uniref:Guanine nucleotide-binding protein subunit gamma-e n=1 Tax=Papilio xuthus TaxID=66420 RepID=A0A194QC61_PAPXU|nr:Guanine nucleotide-binding protein subunit gamma-e [Papilio xuthus]
MDASILAAMDKEALKKQIENMKYQASMERWPLSKSIAAVHKMMDNIVMQSALSFKEIEIDHEVQESALGLVD